MPKLAPISPDDLEMGSVYGADGTTRPFGMFLHRFVLDVSTHTPQSIEDFPIFLPDGVMTPFMIVYTSFTWQLDDASMDNAEVSIGGNGTVDDLIQAAPIDQGNNGNIIGDDFGEIQTDLAGGLLQRDQGSTSHEHWEKVLSGFAGGDPVIATPVQMRVDSTPATAGPYDGTITAHILWASLRRIVP